MNLLIVTHYLENYSQLGELTTKNKGNYADRHGYDLFAQIGNYCDWGFDFQRIKIIYDLLFKDRAEMRENGRPLGYMKIPDVIWWLGCDTMVMNMTKPVTDFLMPENKSLYIHKDVNGINNDSFLIRRTEWSKKWLEFVMSKEPEYKGDCWESQRVFQHYVEKPEWNNQVEILSHPGVNSYFYDEYNWPETTPGHIRKGDLLLHLPGMRLDQRMNIFTSQRVKDLMIE